MHAPEKNPVWQVAFGEEKSFVDEPLPRRTRAGGRAHDGRVRHERAYETLSNASLGTGARENNHIHFISLGFISEHSVGIAASISVELTQYFKQFVRVEILARLL